MISRCRPTYQQQRRVVCPGFGCGIGLLGRPVSESGTLCPVARARGQGGRRPPPPEGANVGYAHVTYDLMTVVATLKQQHRNVLAYVTEVSGRHRGSACTIPPASCKRIFLPVA